MSYNLDRLFKKAFQDKTCEPPPYIWENIDRQLGDYKHPAIYWLYSGIAVAALVVALIGIWFLHSDPAPKVKLVEIMEEFPRIQTEPSKLTDPEISEKQFFQGTFFPILQTAALNYQPKKVHSEPVVRQYAKITALKHTTLQYLNTAGLRKDFIPLTSQEAIENNKKYQALLAEKITIPQPEKKKFSFEISGHFIPVYSSGSYSSEVKSPRGSDYSSNEMDGLMNTGGGLRLAVHTGKRLSIQTGVYYSRMGQKTSEKVTTNRQYAVLQGLRNSEKIKTTPLGNVKSRTKAVAYRNPQAMVMNSIGNYDQTIEQTFGTVEIPLQLRCQLNENKILFSLVGGICGNFIVNNKVYLKSGESKELLGSTEDMRHFNISTDWGLGITCPITRKMKIMIEPGFKYYLQSLSQNENIDFKPYLFTLSTGIGIEF